MMLQSVPDSYYKVRQVLQSVTVITKWDIIEVLVYLGIWISKWFIH